MHDIEGSRRQAPQIRPAADTSTVRKLLPLPPVTGRAPAAIPAAGRVIALVDCEATSLDASKAKIIELAVMALIVDEHGHVIGNTPISSWLEDPKEALSEEVKLVTGLENAMLVGRRIDERAFMGIIRRAQVIVAHNAAYDARLIERRFPDVAGMPWACSVREIDWLRLGYDGGKLGHLVMQSGWFCDGHRAGNDVAALFHLLQLNGSIDGDQPQTHLQRLLLRADRPTVRVAAVRPGFGHSDGLKARGYRWDIERKSWWIDVDEDGADIEDRWLRREGIWAIDHQLQTACERHRPMRRAIPAPVQEGGDPF